MVIPSLTGHILHSLHFSPFPARQWWEWCLGSRTSLIATDVDSFCRVIDYGRYFLTIRLAYVGLEADLSSLDLLYASMELFQQGPHESPRRYRVHDGIVQQPEPQRRSIVPSYPVHAHRIGVDCLYEDCSTWHPRPNTPLVALACHLVLIASLRTTSSVTIDIYWPKNSSSTVKQRWTLPYNPMICATVAETCSSNPSWWTASSKVSPKPPACF